MGMNFSPKCNNCTQYYYDATFLKLYNVSANLHITCAKYDSIHIEEQDVLYNCFFVVVKYCVNLLTP